MTATRRRFLLSAAATTGAGIVLGTTPSAAIEPIRRTGKSHLRLSLAAYSYRKYLDIKAKTKPSMTLDQFAEQAATMGLDAIEPTSYYFPETTLAYMAHLKAHCTRLGLDISGTAVSNDFCRTDPAKLKADLAHVKKWVEYASILGCKTIRIFAGRLEKGDTEEKALARCVATIQEACDHAAKYGIFLALENHGGVTATAEQLLAIVKAVKHECFGVNLDTGNFHTADPYGDLARVAPYAVTVQVKTEIFRAGSKTPEEADLKKEIDILRKANYRGYVALEYEAKEEPRVAVPRYIDELRKLMG